MIAVALVLMVAFTTGPAAAALEEGAEATVFGTATYCMNRTKYDPVGCGNSPTQYGFEHSPLPAPLGSVSNGPSFGRVVMGSSAAVCPVTVDLASGCTWQLEADVAPVPGSTVAYCDSHIGRNGTGRLSYTDYIDPGTGQTVQFTLSNVHWDHIVEVSPGVLTLALNGEARRSGGTTVQTFTGLVTLQSSACIHSPDPFPLTNYPMQHFALSAELQIVPQLS